MSYEQKKEQARRREAKTNRGQDIGPPPNVPATRRGQDIGDPPRRPGDDWEEPDDDDDWDDDDQD